MTLNAEIKAFMNYLSISGYKTQKQKFN